MAIPTVTDENQNMVQEKQINLKSPFMLNPFSVVTFVINELGSGLRGRSLIDSKNSMGLTKYFHRTKFVIKVKTKNYDSNSRIDLKGKVIKPLPF